MQSARLLATETAFAPIPILGHSAPSELGYVTRVDVAKHLRRVEALPGGSHVGKRDRLAELGHVGDSDYHTGLPTVEIRIEFSARHARDLADRLPEQPERRAHHGRDSEICHEFHAGRRRVDEPVVLAQHAQGSFQRTVRL